MAETDKIPKSAVLYIHKRGASYKCSGCLFAKMQGTKCALYGPHVTIKPYGSCGNWIAAKGHIDVPFVGGYNMTNTGYVENFEGFSCARCEEFLPKTNDCKKVDCNSPGDDPGTIQPGGCCCRWSKIENNE